MENIGEVSSAVEESKSRNFIYMAGLCDYADAIRAKVENIICETILIDYKLNFYSERLEYGALNYAVAALMSTLVYLDYDLEQAFVTSVLRELSSYDIDGIFRFRLKALRGSWQEISEMCNRLFAIGTDDADIYNVISYITATKTQKAVNLLLTGGELPVLKNLTSNSEIRIKKVYGIFEYDLINAVISASATRLTVDGYDLNKDALRALKHIVRVKINS